MTTIVSQQGKKENEVPDLVEIPVLLVDQSGHRTTDQIQGTPCIEAAFFFSRVMGNDMNVKAAWCLASIDTCEPDVLVDEKLIAAYNAPIVNSNPKSAQYFGSIFLMSVGHTFNLPVRSIKIEGKGKPRIVLGRLFLQFAKLELGLGSAKLTVSKGDNRYALRP